ncbi:hypothetical protein ABFS83_13G189000 [Erythranthe nasuta]
MWDDEEDNGAAGRVPEFGAIFMSSTETKKECFKHNVFALPSHMGKFVKHIKAGMVLFLFEFKKRQLFGVYQASCDGALDIVPHAFNHSGMHFPAQVSFTPIWYCDPLSEHEFRDAIRENYFSAKKFNFGLSKDQVRRLLSLFSSRKLENKRPPHVLAEPVVRGASKDKKLAGDDRFALSKSGYMESMEHGEFNPFVYRCDHGNSLARAKEAEVFIDDGVNTEQKEHAFAGGDFLPKKRRRDTDDRLIRNYMAENGTYNHGTSRTFQFDSSMYPSDEGRKLADRRRLSSVERVHNGGQVDGVLNPVLPPDYLISPLDARSSDDDRFMERLRLFDEYKMDHGSGQAYAKDPYGKPLSKNKYGIDEHIQEHRFYDDFHQRDHGVQPMVYGDDNLDLFRQTREVMGGNRGSMTSKLESRYHLDCDGCDNPVSDFEQSADLLHNLRKTTAGGRFPFNDRVESKPYFGTCSMEDFSSENLSRPLHSGHRIVRESNYPLVEGRVTENMDDNIFFSTFSTRKNRYPECLDGRVVNDGRYVNSDRGDNEAGIQMVISPFNTMEYPSPSKRSFPEKLLPEKRRSPLTAAHNFDFFRSKFDDATIIRAVPYMPEENHGYSASVAAHLNSNLVQENHPHHAPVGNFSFKNTSSPYYSELQSSRSLDIGPEFGNKCPSTNASVHQSSLLHKTTGSVLNSKLSMHTDVNTSAHVNHSGPLFPISAPPAYSGSESTRREKGLLFAYPSISSENHCAFDRNLPTASQHESEHAPLQDMYMFAGKDFIRSGAKDVGISTYPERDITSYEGLYMNPKENKRDVAGYENLYMNMKETHEISEDPDFGSNANRKSVFSRLTSRHERQLSERKSDRNFNCQGGYTDATADEVMEMLKHANNLSARKPKKSRVVAQPEHGNSAVDGKQIQGNIEINHSAMEKEKPIDVSKAITESIDEAPEETRVTDFKRRSEIDKKSLVRTGIEPASKAIPESIDGGLEETRAMDFKRRSETDKSLVRTGIESPTGNKIIVANEEVKSSTKTTLKRKKLIRPVFRNNEGSDSLLPRQILDKGDEQSCEKAISIRETKMLNINTRLENVQASIARQFTGGDIKEPSNSEEQKDLPSASNDELKENVASNMDLQIGSPQVLLEETIQLNKSHGIKNSTEGILSEDIDAKVSSFNLEESNSEGFKLAAGCRDNLIDEEKLRMLRSRMKIIRTNWTGMKPSQ